MACRCYRGADCMGFGSWVLNPSCPPLSLGGRRRGSYLLASYFLIRWPSLGSQRPLSLLLSVYISQRDDSFWAILRQV